MKNLSINSGQLVKENPEKAHFSINENLTFIRNVPYTPFSSQFLENVDVQGKLPNDQLPP